MNRTAQIIVGLLLAALGVALFIYRLNATSLPEPMPIVVTLGAVAFLIAGIGVMKPKTGGR